MLPAAGVEIKEVGKKVAGSAAAKRLLAMQLPCCCCIVLHCVALCCSVLCSQCVGGWLGVLLLKGY